MSSVQIVYAGSKDLLKNYPFERFMKDKAPKRLLVGVSIPSSPLLSEEEAIAFLSKLLEFKVQICILIGGKFGEQNLSTKGALIIEIFPN